LYDGQEWCDVDRYDGYSNQQDVSPDANGNKCNTRASHTIQDVIGMVKCKSAYSKERIPTFAEYTNYDAKNFFGMFIVFSVSLIRFLKNSTPFNKTTQIT
jgi:hypothetical protein